MSAYNFLVLASLWSPILLRFIHLAFILTGPRNIVFPAYCELRTTPSFLIFICCNSVLQIYDNAPFCYCLRIGPSSMLFLC
jgi:hypothetical protein